MTYFQMMKLNMKTLSRLVPAQDPGDQLILWFLFILIIILILIRIIKRLEFRALQTKMCTLSQFCQLLFINFKQALCLYKIYMPRATKQFK